MLKLTAGIDGTVRVSGDAVRDEKSRAVAHADQRIKISIESTENVKQVTKHHVSKGFAVYVRDGDTVKVDDLLAVMDEVSVRAAFKTGLTEGPISAIPKGKIR